MLEGKELQGKIGEVGEYYADVDHEGKLQLGVSVKIDLLGELKKLAAKTQTPIDDQAVAWIEQMLKTAAQLELVKKQEAPAVQG